MFEQIVPRQCANECIFCFCKGNPDDARPSLFVRDEDIRLSFLYGNYTTLSSITEDEMNRIVEQRLSPQYVSIHATDLKTRAYLLGVDEKRADITKKLQRLLDNDVEIHAQVVLCPSINDGDILERTLRDLAAQYPKVISTAVVPVALTRYNTDDRLTRVTPEFCRGTISRVENLQKEFRRTLGTTFAFLGDEIYLKAGVEIPSRRHYGNYPQIEDGVGMVRSFLNAFRRVLSEPPASAGGSNRKYKALNPRVHAAAVLPSTVSSFNFRLPASAAAASSGSATIITGEMFAPILREQVELFNQQRGTSFYVLPVPNTYFGGDVSVAGLLSGRDVVAVKDQLKGCSVIIPKHIIKSDEPILIDGMPFDELKERLGVPIIAFDTAEFIEYLSIQGAAADPI
jgi:NifB/MoaA-like Fe-S oxidoreductase